MLTIILLGILGAVISAVIGTFWYSMKTPMGRLHMQTTGFLQLSKEEQERKIQEMKPKMWKYYALQMLLSFITSVFIAYIMTAQKGFSSVIIYEEIAAVWLCFTVPVIGQALLWGNVDLKLRWKKFFSDSLSNLVTFIIIAFVFSLII